MRCSNASTWLPLVLLPLALACSEDEERPDAGSAADAGAILPDASTSDGGGTGGGMEGAWSCTKTSNVTSGPCLPAQKIESGTCTFTATSMQASGAFACSPATACTFQCSAVGAAVTCQNSGPDGAGGQYSSTMQFTATSASQATGTGSSTWTGAGGSCQWAVSMTLTR